MQLTQVLALAGLISGVYSHGLVTSIQGSNGVNMPGLGVIDGTPRDCSTKACGAENDTPIIRPGNANPLGKTKGGGQINAANAVAQFMGQASPSPAAPAAQATPSNAARAVDDDVADDQETEEGDQIEKRELLVVLGSRQSDATPTKTPPGTVENGTAAAAGQGAQSGLPTVGQNGVVTMNFHQVNGDGAGPYTASIDPTSGGTNAAAFQPAQMISNIPGTNGKDKANKASDFQVQVQMPAGMICQGQVAGQQGVCVVRMTNTAKNGPFGGSAVFQQEGAQQSPSAAAATPAATPAAGRRAVPMRFERRY
jgi:Egh16-like virulence factor